MRLLILIFVKNIIMSKYILTVICFTIFCGSTFSQEKSGKRKLLPFNKLEIGYYFGLEESLNNQKYNHVNLKTIIGLKSDRLAFGIGVANDSYNSGGTTQNTLNTLGFSGNLHYIFSDLSEEGNKVFIKSGAGYAPRIFRTYSKGFTYNAGVGYIITTRRQRKYFAQVSYNVQNIENFSTITSNAFQIKSVGLNIGTWF